MSFLEGESSGEEAGGVCEGVVGGGGVGVGSVGDVQHEFGSGSAVCGGGSGDDGEGSAFGADSCEEGSEAWFMRGSLGVGGFSHWGGEYDCGESEVI